MPTTPPPSTSPGSPPSTSPRPKSNSPPASGTPPQDATSSTTTPSSPTTPSNGASQNSDASPTQDQLSPSGEQHTNGNGLVINGVNGSDSSGAVAGAGGHTDADGEVFSDEWLADMRRVKVYELVGQRWTDRGTALCTGIYDEDLDQAAIVARSELHDVELLRSEIRMNDVYQRQQETLIVWTEPDGTDYALSFQDVEGCAEIWDFIIEVQRHFRGKLGDPSGPSSSSPARDPRAISAHTIINAGRLPEPALGIISEIDKAIKYIARSPNGKEKICEYIVGEDYIKGLIDVLHQAEDLEALADLHSLCNLMQTILMMNDHSIYDYILQDEIYTGVIGMLEYDPDFPAYKASFRDYLANSTKYKEVVVFRDETIRKKIHQTYRLQYLKDVVLARVLDDPTFNVLNSFILFNQIDIINHIQSDEALLKDLFERFDESAASGSSSFAPVPPAPETKAPSEGKGKEKEVNGPSEPGCEAAPSSSGEVPSFLANLTQADTAKRDIIILLHQLCMMGKNVQIPARLALYRSLVDKGMLHALQWALSRPPEDQQMLNSAGEILLIVYDHDVTGIRAFVLKQADPNGDWDKPPVPGAKSAANSMMGMYESMGMKTDVLSFGMGGMGAPQTIGERRSAVVTLLTVICRVLTSSKDLALRGQMAEALKTLLELPNAEENSIMKTLPRMKEDPVTERFLQYFYDSCVGHLYLPLTRIPECKDITTASFSLTRDQSSVLLYLCDNLCNFVTQHSHRSQFFVLSTNISKRIATLLKAREKHLQLAALRFFRMCIRMNNNFLLRHLIKNELLLPILELASKENRHDNLVNSACQDFFEHIRKENIRIVINHIMEKYEPRVRELCKYGFMGERFKGLVTRWEQNNEPAPKDDRNGVRSRLGRPGTGLLTAAIMDAEEEDEYFNGSDDEEIGPPLPPPPTASPPQTLGPQVHIGMKRKRSSRLANGAGRPRANATHGPKEIVLPTPFPMKLVDYEGEEDDSSSPRDKTPPAEEEQPPPPHKEPHRSQVLVRTRSSTQLMASSANGASPKKVNGSTSSPGGALSPPRISEKRRRDEEDDDTLGLLAGGSKAAGKRAASANASKAKSPATVPSSEPAPSGDEQPTPTGSTAKKIKLSLGKSSIGIATAVASALVAKKEEASRKSPG